MVFYECSKNIKINFHYVQNCLYSGLMSLHFVPSIGQLANLMTKPLPGPLSHPLLHNLEVYFPFNLTWGIGPTIIHPDDRQILSWAQLHFPYFCINIYTESITCKLKIFLYHLVETRENIFHVSEVNRNFLFTLF